MTLNFSDETTAKDRWEAVAGRPYEPTKWAPPGKTLRFLSGKSGYNPERFQEWVSLEFMDEDGRVYCKLAPIPGEIGVAT